MIPSWRFWRALRYSSINEALLYHHIATIALVVPIALPRVKLRRRTVLLIALLLFIYFLQSYGYDIFYVMLIAPIGLTAIFIFIALLFPLFQPLILSLVAGLVAASLSYRLVKERVRRGYDLLCLLPDGEIGANWAIAAATLHQRLLFAVPYQVIMFSLILGIFYCVVMLSAILFDIFHEPGAEALVLGLRTMLDVIVIIAVYYLHHIQTLTLSVFVGISTPMVLRSLKDASWIALMLFWLLQLGSYGLILLIVTLISPLLLHLTPEAGPIFPAVPLVYLLVFMLVRETLLLLYWDAIRRILGMSRAESWEAIRRFSGLLGR